MTEDSSTAEFYKVISKMGEGQFYMLVLFMLSTFMSRERFWYYLIVMTAGHCLMISLKLFFHDPRPIHVWSDIWSTGCEMHFGNPSGHNIDAFNVTIMLFLDLFVPSDYSKQTQPNLNTRTYTNSKRWFILAIFVIFTWCPLIMIDRLLLGKHTLDQVILGACIGVWCAFFFHFC